MSAPFADPLTQQIVAFLRDIGLEVRAARIERTTALPGIDIENGRIVIDEARLAYPGDVLHEAGHLAVVPPERRARFHHDVGNDPSEEMMAIAWSYAAALHIGIDPAVVLHDDGYRGGQDTQGEGGGSILRNFDSGYYFGVPMLQYAGMAIDPAGTRRHGLGDPFPHMLRWLRAEPGDAAPDRQSRVHFI